MEASEDAHITDSTDVTPQTEDVPMTPGVVDETMIDTTEEEMKDAPEFSHTDMDDANANEMQGEDEEYDEEMPVESTTSESHDTEMEKRMSEDEMNEPVPEVDDSTDVTSPLPSAVLAPNDPSVPNDDNVSQEDGQTENKPTDTSTTDEVDATNLETPNLVHETTQESSELIEESQTSETSETLETSETSESLESSQTVSEIETIPLETGTGNVTKVVVEEAEEMEIPADPIKVVEAHVESIVELPTTPVVKEATSTEAKVEEPQISQEVDAETPLEVSTSEPQVEEATSSDTEVPISNGDVDESQQPIVEEISQEQGSVEAEEHENESDQHSPQTADESHQQEDDDEEAGHEDHYDQEHEEHVQEEQYPHDEEYEEDGPDINHYFATENDSSHSHPPDSLPHTPLDLDHPQLDNGDQVEDGVESQVEDGVEDQVESQVEDQVESQEGSEENQEEEKEVSPEEEKTPQVEVQHEEDSTFKLKKRSRSEDLEEHPPVDSPQLLDLGTPNSENSAKIRGILSRFFKLCLLSNLWMPSKFFFNTAASKSRPASTIRGWWKATRCQDLRITYCHLF
eukprot:TRINITY_DN3150_c1_g1_i4.p1 TRINITY_DN3150_c1_g1~~TRINITY_DN3150_c1_g1_i4.p1  ORF type:complete len:581 (+),score=180.23 TRINITY_DN3150_c1_g1_i4:29-1744(+)